jgi:hypothetical protein
LLINHAVSPMPDSVGGDFTFMSIMKYHYKLLT